MNQLQRIAQAAIMLAVSFNLTAAEEAPKAAERAPKGVEEAKQIHKYDADGDAKEREGAGGQDQAADGGPPSGAQAGPCFDGTAVDGALFSPLTAHANGWRVDFDVRVHWRKLAIGSRSDWARKR